MDRLNPFCKLAYFIFLFILLILIDNPIFLFIFYFLINIYLFKDNRGYIKIFAYILVFIIFYFVLYILNNHYGVSNLYKLRNGNNITLEAIVGGINKSLFILSLITYILFFQRYIFRDDISYILGSIYPKASIYFSISLRLLKDFNSRLIKNREGRKALSLRGFKDFFKSLSTNFFYLYERSIKQYEIMNLRGFNLSKRSFYKIYKFDNLDRLYLEISGLLYILIIFLYKKNILYFIFNPEIIYRRFDFLTYFSFLLIAIYLMFPYIIDRYYFYKINKELKKEFG